ncbi:hypothetical protein GQX74_012107, partial [Glossina fuscipes]
DFHKMLRYCKVIRVITHSQVRVIKQSQKKAHAVVEIQLNGGSIEDKMKWVRELLEKPVAVSKIFGQDEMIDCIGGTKVKGFKDVTSHWHTKKKKMKGKFTHKIGTMS